MISNSISPIVEIIEPSGMKDSGIELRMEEAGKTCEEASEVEGAKRQRTAGEELIAKDKKRGELKAKGVSEQPGASLQRSKGVSEQPGASLRRGTAGEDEETVPTPPEGGPLPNPPSS